MPPSCNITSVFEGSQEAVHSLLILPANAGIKLRGRPHCMVGGFRFILQTRCSRVGGGLLLTIAKNIMQPRQDVAYGMVGTLADNYSIGIQFETETMVLESRPIKNGLSFHNSLMRRAAQFRPEASRTLGVSGCTTLLFFHFRPSCMRGF